MSSKIKGLNIKIGADMTGLDTALKNIENTSKSTNSELRLINSSLKQNKDSVVLWQQKQQVLTKAIENSKEKTNALLQAQKGIEQAFRDGDIDRNAYDKFKEKLQKSSDKLKDLKNQQTDFENKFKSGEIDKDTYDKFVEKVKRAEREVQGLENSQRSMQENVRIGTISEEQYRAFQREIESSANRTRNLNEQLRDANENIQRLGNQSENTADDVENLTEEVQNSSETVQNSANGGYTVLGNVFANIITEGIKLAGNTLKDFTKDVITTGEEYEAAISNVVAISGAMSDDVKLLEAKAEEMGAKTKFTAAESAEAMSYMAMAGWKTDDMLSGLDGIMNLAAASGEDLASVSDIVTDALTAFGLQASDSAHFADVLAAASSNSNTNVAMMGETFQYAAPIAGTLKYSIEDMAIATGLMANSGIKASQAGTTLNSALSRLAKPTKEMKTYMQQLGLATTQTFDKAADPDAVEKAMRIVEDRTLSAENAQIKLNQAIEKYGENSDQALIATNNLTKAQNSLEEAQEAVTSLQAGETVSIIDKNLLLTDENGNLKSLRDTIDTLKNAFSGLSEVQQAEAASALFGKNSMAGMLAIVNSKTEDYNKLADAVDNANGAAQGMADTMLDNLQGDKTLFESAFDGVKISLSKELNPALRELVKYGTEQMPKIQKSLEPIVDGIIKVAKNIPKAIDSLEKAKPVISAICTDALAIFAGIKAVQITKKIKTSLIPAISSLWGLIAAHPIGAIITAVGLVGTAITKGIFTYLDAQLEVKSETEKLIEKHNEEIQLLADKRKAVKDLNDAFYENTDGIQNQTDRTQDLWKELDRLTDKSGNVQQKDQERAKYILGELNEALGTEYSMTDNQINGYKLLSAEIDNVIAKKQAEMMVDAYLANSSEMNKQRIEAKSDYEKYDKEYQEQQKALEDAERRFDIFKKNMMNGSNITADDYVAGNFADGETSTVAGKKLAQAVITAREKVQHAENARTQAKITFDETSEYFQKLDEIQEAYSLEQYSRISDIIYAEKDLTSTTLDDSMSDAEQRLQAYNDYCLKTLSDFDLTVKDLKQKSVDEMEKEISELVRLGLIAGKTPEEIWENFSEDFDKIQAEGLDISPLITPFIDSGLEPSKAFDDWKKTFRTQYENDGDMNSIIEWLGNSRYYRSIPYVFGSNDEYVKYLKEQSASGLDISDFLVFGANAGLAESSEEFVSLFKENVERNLANGWDVAELLDTGNRFEIDLAEQFSKTFGEQMQILADNGIDLSEFVSYAESHSKSLADLSGENFLNELSTYISENATEKLTNVQQKLEAIGGSALGSMLGIAPVTLSEKLIKSFNNGDDISELAKITEKQGINIADVFGDNYTDVIQQQIDKGYSIVELLEWGEKSGLKVGDMLGENYTDEAQSFVDEGFSIQSLLSWATLAGIDAGTLFGEKFQEYADLYISEHEEYQKVSQNTGGFIKNNILDRLPFMADGGFLAHGQAVVAEAGPELLEVVNGGVRVTPLTENSRNLATNKNQIINYNNYTINATISNGYDVARLAEDLETERRRIERGMGK